MVTRSRPGWEGMATSTRGWMTWTIVTTKRKPQAQGGTGLDHNYQEEEPWPDHDGNKEKVGSGHDGQNYKEKARPDHNKHKEDARPIQDG